MVLNISSLTTEWSPLTFNIPPTQFPVLAELSKNDEAHFKTPLSMDFTTRFAQGQIEIKGTIVLTVELSCARCLETFTAEIAAPIHLSFVEKAPLEEEPENGEEIELTEESLNHDTFEGDHIDLIPILQDEVVMALPLTPICNSTCKGLCLECGKNLNKGECGCDTTTCHPAFAKLKLLKGGK